MCVWISVLCFFKQKTACEMRISDWSSDVCSSDLGGRPMTATLDLWPIGNCQVSALIDRSGRFVWGCTPRVDGAPAFCSLLDDEPPAGEGAYGFWEDRQSVV